ncbi:hypothetical protein [Bacillus zhangzhouensis]|uniref:response regulator aspartate phosphatase n=1 Tax=Bacillus zhangzhouensis TaxID=1178540 RepID=UPI0020BF6D96|nr:hypothetical protein [Bacillus zhangzhouensis]
MKSIPAAAGQKINEWYRHIKKLNVTDAEMLRDEIKRELDVMEEDEQAVLYFQLMDFRHELFLLCSMPKNQKKSPPAGKFGLVFGLLGFEVLVFKKMAVAPAF